MQSIVLALCGSVVIGEFQVGAVFSIGRFIVCFSEYFKYFFMLRRMRVIA